MGGNITNYWEDDGETKSRQVGNIRDLKVGSTREMGEAVFFEERGGIPIPSSEYARQNGLPEVHQKSLLPLPPPLSVSVCVCVCVCVCAPPLYSLPLHLLRFFPGPEVRVSTLHAPVRVLKHTRRSSRNGS